MALFGVAFHRRDRRVHIANVAMVMSASGAKPPKRGRQVPMLIHSYETLGPSE